MKKRIAGDDAKVKNSNLISGEKEPKRGEENNKLRRAGDFGSAELLTSFSANISRNELMRVSRGTMARSRAARTSASIAASLPTFI